MSELLVHAVNISKSFQKQEILHDVSLDVSKGEVVCIIGPSGAGKSTFLRCLNHLEIPDKGEVWIDGQPLGYKERNGELYELSPKEVAHQRRPIGMVFQRFNLFPHRTVLGNVIEGPVHVLGVPKSEAERQGREALAQVGLAGFESRYPEQLSGGQQQRVAIARSLAMNPELILFDEPTSALDPELVGEVLHVMTDLADRGMTMVVVTHLIGFAEKVADTIAFMANGEIVEQGPPSQLLNHPKDQRLKKFLSEVI